MQRTNKEVLSKGIKFMLIAMMLLILGPFLFHLGFKLRNYLTLTIASLVSIAAILMFFKGIKTLIKALFND
ncbi:DUF6095 family protein [Pseudofulvibacter geojedonensis]|uniref:DUF6095 family protein n=1 Tax=Pseudofulvibacter geojedonensis TaxID=1123758 RepID=A0ABW3HYV5_9FLAO